MTQNGTEASISFSTLTLRHKWIILKFNTIMFNNIGICPPPVDDSHTTRRSLLHSTNVCCNILRFSMVLRIVNVPFGGRHTPRGFEIVTVSNTEGMNILRALTTACTRAAVYNNTLSISIAIIIAELIAMMRRACRLPDDSGLLFSRI